MVLTIFDFLLIPIYLLVIYYFASRIQHKNIKDKPLYKWYTKGLMVKILGAIAVCLMYQLYYTGGDTTNYYETSKAIANLLYKDSYMFWDVIVITTYLLISTTIDIKPIES